MAEERPGSEPEAKDLTDAQARRAFWADDQHPEDGGWRPGDGWEVVHALLPLVTIPIVIYEIGRDFLDSLRERRK